MSSRGTKRSRAKKANAIEAIQTLESTILQNGDTTVSNSAADLILKIGKKHGIRRNRYVGFGICRKCKKSLIPGRNSRLRIRSKSLKLSCLECKSVRTLGPSFRRA